MYIDFHGKQSPVFFRYEYVAPSKITFLPLSQEYFVYSGKNELRIRIVNLAVNEIGLKDDLNILRHWGWTGTPPDSVFDAGLFGPVRIIIED